MTFWHYFQIGLGLGLGLAIAALFYALIVGVFKFLTAE